MQLRPRPAPRRRALGDRNVDIDDALITAYEPPAEIRSASVGLDCVLLPTIDLLARPPGRPKKGAARRPLAVVWNMMWVATVTLHDKNGDALHTLRYGAMPVDGCGSLLHGAAGDVNELLRKLPRLKICLLSDGAHDLVEHLQIEVAARVDREVMQVMQVSTSGTSSRSSVPRRICFSAITRSASRLGGFACSTSRPLRWTSSPNCVRPAASTARSARPRSSTAITYLSNGHARMNYDALRAAGLPIFSGNTEATCKTLVEIRMKRAFSRWNIDTARHVIQLRALATSDQWSEALDLTLRPLRKAVPVAA